MRTAHVCGPLCGQAGRQLSRPHQGQDAADLSGWLPSILRLPRLLFTQQGRQAQDGAVSASRGYVCGICVRPGHLRALPSSCLQNRFNGRGGAGGRGVTAVDRPRQDRPKATHPQRGHVQDAQQEVHRAIHVLQQRGH
eukprot:GHVL01038175.1.p2 GENE.GHVL01038175.1~~GHVL01038175.1.p2  ORF type:complete len:138 (+),score=14.91 GHVL01038175.1:321-734(+)